MPSAFVLVNAEIGSEDEVLNDLKNANFVRITNSGITESHAHDVTITSEAPNYSRQ